MAGSGRKVALLRVIYQVSYFAGDDDFLVRTVFSKRWKASLSTSPGPDDVTRFQITAGGVGHHGGSESDRDQVEAAWDRDG